MSNLQKKITQMITFNWKPKLICLALAVVIWTVVECFFVQSATNKGWDLDRIRLSLPE